MLKNLKEKASNFGKKIAKSFEKNPELYIYGGLAVCFGVYGYICYKGIKMEEATRMAAIESANKQAELDQIAYEQHYKEVHKPTLDDFCSRVNGLKLEPGEVLAVGLTPDADKFVFMHELNDGQCVREYKAE